LFIDRKSFACELSGDLVEKFRGLLSSTPSGLPIVVLQFAKLTQSQGLVLFHLCLGTIYTFNKVISVLKFVKFFKFVLIVW
jgi:hypothetical protein